MRQATLGLFYVVKYLELCFLCVWTGLLFSSAFYFIDLITEQSDINSKDQQCIIFIGISLVLVLWNLFYNNLLINLRFLAKMRCVTFGMCVFDAFNYLFCYCFLQKPCRDKCFTPWSIIKWLIKGGIIGYTIYLITDKKNAWDDEFEEAFIESDKSDTTRLDMYFIVYLVQHPIFIISRFPIFLLYTILTCCCDKGEEIDDNEEFQDRILSFDFVQYELGRLNNFQNHPVGRNELEYNRRLSFVRAQSIRQRPDAAAPSESIIQRAQARLGGTIYATLGVKATGECSICFMPMKAGERICQLACHPQHQFHETCYDNFIAHNANQPALKLCPLCRVPINEEAVKKLVYKEAKPTEMDATEAFGLDPDAKKVQDVVNENQFAVDATAEANASPNRPMPSDAGLMNPSGNLDVIVAPAGAPLVLPPMVNPPQGPARQGTVHIDELPVPPMDGDDDMPQSERHPENI